MEAAVTAIQQLYPQIWHACHVAHSRRRSDPLRLSERDGAILAHLTPDWAPTSRELAAHFGIGAPTMSAAVQRLERLGFVERSARTAASAARPLRLTERGRAALQGASPLDTGRVTALLGALSLRERERAVDGLRLLARAARSLPHGARRRREEVSA